VGVGTIRKLEAAGVVTLQQVEMVGAAGIEPATLGLENRRYYYRANRINYLRSGEHP
jgi:hypothetical protein